MKRVERIYFFHPFLLIFSSKWTSILCKEISKIVITKRHAMKEIRILTLVIFASVSLNAQNFVDALRYSNFEVMGTARTVGVGGALGALGTDFSVLSTNPAGIALNRKSEFNITPALIFTNVESELTNGNNAPVTETDGQVVINNIGIIAHSAPRSRYWRTMNFGIGMNKIAEFNRSTFFEGQSIGSITDRFLEIANSNGLDNFDSGVAADAQAIYMLDDPNDLSYYSDFDLAPDAEVYKNQLITEEGSINELSIGLAGNFNEKIMIGFSLGVPFVSYTQEKIYREEDRGTQNDGDIPFFESLTFRENITTTGTGINAKLGIIARVNQAVRFGVAVHTPTAFRLEDNFTTSMQYTFTDGVTTTGEGNSPDGFSEFRLSTPWKFIGSAGFIFNKSGFLTGEIELVNYKNNSISFDGFQEQEDFVNQDISTQLSSVINVRVGGEIAVNQMRYRAGVGFKQSPFEGDEALDPVISAGLGIRLESFYSDLAFRYDQFREGYIPYLTTDFPEQFVQTDTRRGILIWTFGFRF